VKVLSLIHQDDAPGGVFAEAARGRGCEVEEWGFAGGGPPPRALGEYDAVIVLGGGMHVDQEGLHPWLREEKAFLTELLAHGTPTLGVCLGAQLLAETAGASVERAPAPRIGWFEVEATRDAPADPLFREVPRRFQAFEWHSYGFDLPAGAVPLARNAALQAYRLGEAVWGMQFHAEVTPEIVAGWLDRYREDEDAVAAGPDPEVLAAVTATRIERWSELGRGLSERFVEQARRHVAARDG
jgi:GMP synthase (glutamine-hydrolysing)